MRRHYGKINCKDCSVFFVPISSCQKRCKPCQEKYYKEYKKEWTRNHPGYISPCEENYPGGVKGYRNEKQKRFDKNHPEYRKEHRDKDPGRYWARHVMCCHKKRSGCTFVFALEDLVGILKEIKTCRYCGCKLIYCYGQGQRKHGPSLDRINNVKKELKLSDVQIICHHCNLIKSDMTHGEFIKYCKKVIKLNETK